MSAPMKLCLSRRHAASGSYYAYSQARTYCYGGCFFYGQQELPKR